MSSSIKKYVKHVGKLTNLDKRTIIDLLEGGWTFSWDIHGDYGWIKNVTQDWMSGLPYPPIAEIKFNWNLAVKEWEEHHKMHPLYFAKLNQPKGPAGDSGASDV